MLELFIDGLDEFLNIQVPGLLGLVQALGNLAEGLAVQILE